MSLVACTTGTVAVYVANGIEHKVPVEAWSHDGATGYVANDLPDTAAEHALVPADRLCGYGQFTGYTAGTKSVIPGTGWEFVEKFDDGTIYHTPVLAFELDGYGWGRPLMVSGEGSVDRMPNDGVEIQPVGGWDSAEQVDTPLRAA